MDFLIVIISILLASSSLCQFFMDYKKGRYFIASIELVSVIMFIVCGASVLWNDVIKTIS